jgi:hypothetical protein
MVRLFIAWLFGPPQSSSFYVDTTGTGTMTLTVGGTPDDDVFVLRPGYMALVMDDVITPTGNIGVAQVRT